jgi:hypothetical protein
MVDTNHFVIPCHPRESGGKAGIQTHTTHATQWDNTKNMVMSATRNLYIELDSRLRGNDEVGDFTGYYIRFKLCLQLWKAQ